MTNVDSLMVDSLQRHVGALETEVSRLSGIISHTHDSISNEIAASDRYMSVASIIIAVLIFILGIYLIWCQYRVEKIKRIVEEKEKEILTLKERVETTNSQINSDLTSLYERLRREETVSLLNRLTEVPEDIDNISTFLLIRDLKKEDFKVLHEAFSKIKDDGNESKNSCYLLVFFQHFAGMAIKDDILRPLVINTINDLVQACFKNDIIKSTSDMVEAMKALSPDIRMQIITPFYQALKNSTFKDMYELFDQLKSVLDQSQWNTIVAQSSGGEEIGEEV